MYFMRILLFAALAACACVDMPVYQVAKETPPIVSFDASADGDLGPQQACFDCLRAPEEPGPECHTAYTACKNDFKCSNIIDCGFRRQCFQGAQSAFFACGYECLKEQGVIQPDEPVLTLAAALFQCLANGACGDICFSSDLPSH
jgi:hypothetical protein